MGFIESPQRVWWRKAIFQIHLWVGIVLALYVIVISISGSVLVFEDEIAGDTPRTLSHALGAKPLSWEGMVAAAQKLHPDYSVTRIEDGSSRGEAISIFLGNRSDPGDRRAASFDPFTGRLLVDRENNFGKYHRILNFIEDLHIELVSGRRIGRPVNGACAAFLLLLCATGIVIWWPGLRRWKQALGVKWSAGWKRVNFDCHSAVGFWTLLMISVWAITGVYFGYAQPVRSALATIIPFAASAPAPKTTWKPGDPTLSLSDLYRQAQRALPGRHIHRMDLPTRPGGTVDVSFEPNQSPHYLYGESVLLNPSTGEILRIRDAWKDGKTGDHLLRMMFMLHFAEFDSLPLRIVFALVGLSPAVLAISGALMWWNRALRKKWSLLLKGNSPPVSVREPEMRQLGSA